jgi:hypothetical protein
MPDLKAAFRGLMCLTNMPIIVRCAMSQTGNDHTVSMAGYCARVPSRPATQSSLAECDVVATLHAVFRWMFEVIAAV